MWCFSGKCNKINGFPERQNSGTYGGRRYFECGQNEGWFVRKEHIVRVLKVNYDNPRVSCGVPIYLGQFKAMGIIRYVGRPQVTAPNTLSGDHKQTRYGVELIDFDRPRSVPSGSDTESFDGITFGDGTLCGRRYFHCFHGQNDKTRGVFLKAADLSVYVKPSRYNLLIHGFILMECGESMCIPSGVIRLMQSFGDQMQLRLTALIEPTSSDAAMGERVLKYESFDICNNICGPPITIRKSGSHTHSSRHDTTISGHYRFTESRTVDFGDYNTKWVTKREDLIFKLDDGSARNIFRSMDCDNEVPLFDKCDSIRQRWRHDIHLRDKDECDHSQILDHISELYQVTTNEIMEQFEQFNIQLYGLKMTS